VGGKSLKQAIELLASSRDSCETELIFVTSLAFSSQRPICAV